MVLVEIIGNRNLKRGFDNLEDGGGKTDYLQSSALDFFSYENGKDRPENRETGNQKKIRSDESADNPVYFHYSILKQKIAHRQLLTNSKF